MIHLSGFHAIEERIKSGKPCGPLLVAKPGPRSRELTALAMEKRIRIERVGTADLDNLAPNHRGVVLEVDEPGLGADTTVDEALAGLGDKRDALALILDEITDPHNYGAILRSADQFGVDMVLSRRRRSAAHADTVTRTSAGAAAWVPQAEAPNLIRAVDQLKEAGFWIYGADMAGEMVWQRDLTGRVALALGAEGTGLSRLLAGRCDALVGLPSLGRVDSLNVSVAAGALLYEVTRQRSAKRAAKG